jgi:RNA recognition motif-containing protein
MKKKQLIIAFLRALSPLQKPVKQGKQILGCSTYNRPNKSAFDKNYVAPHKRSDFHKDYDEHPSSCNDGDSGHVNQLSFSQQKDIDAKFSIFVGSLTEKVQQEDLTRLFSQFGSLKKLARIYKQLLLTLFLTVNRSREGSGDQKK